jgi:hypothetical protein
LPTVAIKIASQYILGLSSVYPKRIGSDPIGMSVAEMNELMNTAGKPIDGMPNHSKKC